MFATQLDSWQVLIGRLANFLVHSEIFDLFFFQVIRDAIEIARCAVEDALAIMLIFVC